MRSTDPLFEEIKELESLSSVSSDGHTSNKTATNDSVSEENIEHLVSVSALGPADEVGVVIDTGERSTRDGFVEELGERLPAIGDLEFEEVLGRNHGLDIGIVACVDLLALLWEVALEKGVEEALQHRLVHGCCPGEFRDELECRVGYAPIYSLHGRCVPAVDIAAREDDFCFGVGFDEFLGEGYGWPVAYGLTMSHQLICRVSSI